MLPKNLIYAFIAVLLLLAASWQSSLHWNILPVVSLSQPGFMLAEFDKRIGKDEQACFSLAVKHDPKTTRISGLLVLANETVVLKEEFDLAGSPTIRKCIDGSQLMLGENLVEIIMRGERLFYHVTVEENPVARLEPAISLRQLGENKVEVRVSNNDNTSYEPLTLYVNDKADHRLYFSGESFSSVERLELEEGQNEVRAQFKGISQSIQVQKPAKFKMLPWLGLPLIALLLCLLAAVFHRQGFFERMAYSLLSFFSILTIAFFLLNLLGLLSALNFVILITLATTGIALLCRRKLAEAAKADWLAPITSIAKLKKISPLFFLLIAIVLFSSLFFNFFTATHYGIWTSFYERQSAYIAENELVPTIDEFSFLGTKPFGYLTAYFFVEAGVSWLTGFGIQQSYAMVMVLAQLAFIGAAVLFFRSFGLGKKSYLGAMAVLFGGFVFSDFSFNIRHVISYSFLLLSLFLARKGRAVPSGLALGMGTFFQTPLIIMYLVLLPAVLTERKTVSQALKSLAIGAVIASLFFLPTILAAGLPHQAKFNVWGYFWSIPLYGFFLDYLPILTLYALFIVPFLLARKISFNRFTTRLLGLLLIFIFIQLNISYRINVAATIVFALLFALLFPKKLLETRLQEYSLTSFFVLSFAVLFIVISNFYPVSPVINDTYAFVKANTSTEANFLNEPYLGHSFIFSAQRKSSADLAVEYANAEMIDDSYAFLKEKDPGILKKYRIDYVVNRSFFLDEKPVGDNLYPELIEFEFLDKIYGNGIVTVHWVDHSRVE